MKNQKNNNPYWLIFTLLLAIPILAAVVAKPLFKYEWVKSASTFMYFAAHAVFIKALHYDSQKPVRSTQGNK